MLAPLVLPVQITAGLLALLWVAGWLWPRTARRFDLYTALLMVLFIPSCVGVGTVVDMFRYGRFDYAQATDIPADGYVEQPDAATKITLYRFYSGHKARFTIETTSLKKWVDERRAQRPELNNTEEPTPAKSFPQEPEILAVNRRLFDIRFRDTGWTYNPLMQEYSAILAADGAGFHLWHLPDTGETYLWASYW